MANVVIRRAHFEDLRGILELLGDDQGAARGYSGPGLDPRYVLAFESINADDNHLLIVMEEDGVLCGCLQISFVQGLTRLGALRGQIESVRIASPQRRGGLGRLMLEWSINECRRRGCALVQLTTDKSRPRALRFYRSLGFVASHEGLKLTLTS
jgi:ribosomal protein S18 acetylase RimI-like enzyme